MCGKRECASSATLAFSDRLFSLSLSLSHHTTTPTSDAYRTERRAKKKLGDESEWNRGIGGGALLLYCCCCSNLVLIYVLFPPLPILSRPVPPPMMMLRYIHERTQNAFPKIASINYQEGLANIMWKKQRHSHFPSCFVALSGKRFQIVLGI